MLALVLSYFGAAVVAPALVSRVGRGAFLLLALVPLVSFGWAASHTAEMADGGVQTQVVAWVPTLRLDLAFAMGSLQWVMVMLVSGIGALVLVYCTKYFPAGEPGLSAFGGHFVAFAGAMLGLVLADDLLVDRGVETCPRSSPLASMSRPVDWRRPHVRRSAGGRHS